MQNSDFKKGAWMEKMNSLADDINNEKQKNIYSEDKIEILKNEITDEAQASTGIAFSALN